MTDIFKKADCSPASLALTAVAQFGLECLQWDPLVMRDSFQDLIGYKLKNKAFDKLQAGLTMIGTDSFLSTIQGFLFCTAACNNKPIDQSTIPYASMKDICWAVYMYRQMLDIDPSMQNISPDVILYIQQLMKVQGIGTLPEYLSFAQPAAGQQEATAVQDMALFQAYKIRQGNAVIQLDKYVAQMQNKLIYQLKELQKAGLIKPQKQAEIA